MIYSCHFASIHSFLFRTENYTQPLRLDPFGSPANRNVVWKEADWIKAITTKLKESKNDSFCFIHTIEQKRDWDAFIDKLELKDYISYEMPYYVTNQNHLNGRRLKFVLLQHPEHPQRKAGKEDHKETRQLLEAIGTPSLN